MDATTWTVSDLTRYIREMFDVDYRLQDLWVEGEVSNLTRARSGHLYFTLKDAAAQIRCVMWKSDTFLLDFEPQHGDAVRAHGRVSVYEAGGAYQLYTDLLEPAGRGDLHAQFEQLKAELEAQGLFDAAHKKALPVFPRVIGVVTSPDAAAFQDILNVLRRRYPLVEVLLAPTLVQGEAAPSQIVRALAAIDGRDDVDVIILARGGGSLEDLWAFNDRRVAYAVYGCRHPVITGVGHETDYTIADFVADVRAPTPSAAAEVATPDIAELAGLLEGYKLRLASELSNRIEMAQWRLDSQRRSLRVLSPIQRVRNLAQRLDELELRAGRAMAGRLRSHRQAVDALGRALAAVSPLATLARGYAIVQRADSGLVVTDPAQVAAGDRLEIQVHRGRFAADVAD
jgi:exodeoxyribonuclease VII large subunit